MDIRKKSLHIDIFATLRDRIVYLEYPPGMPLIEKNLCDEFKVSRTPLREAIRKLEEINLATVMPRYGSHVSADHAGQAGRTGRGDPGGSGADGAKRV
jgi:DNA-binding GntR family transcriptional regulator